MGPRWVPTYRPTPSESRNGGTVASLPSLAKERNPGLMALLYPWETFLEIFVFYLQTLISQVLLEYGRSSIDFFFNHIFFSVERFV